MMLCLVFGLIGLSVTGCGKMTPEKLGQKIEKAAEDNFISGKNLDVSFDASYDTQLTGIELSMDIQTSMNIEEIICKDTFEIYSKSDIKTEFLDQNYEYTNETYRIEEADGNLSTYTYNGLSDEWSKDNTDMSPMDYYQTFYFEMTNLEPDFANAVLNEEKAVFEGKDAYTITAECSGIDLFEALEISGFLSEMDYSVSLEMIKEMRIPIVCTIDAESYIPLKIEAETEAFSEFMAALLKAELEMQSSEEGQQSVNVQVEECSFIMSDFSYDEKTIPEFPESARNSFSIINMLDFMGGTFADGTLLLLSGSKAARFDESVLEGYGFYGARIKESITLQSEDETKMVHCEAMSKAMARQYFRNTEDTLKSLLKEFDIEANADWSVETVDTHLGKADVYCMHASDGLTVFNTVIVTEHISVCISAFDFIGEWYAPAPVIAKITSAISEVTAETLPFLGYGTYSDYDGSTLEEMMSYAAEGKHVSSAEVYFSKWGIFIAKDKGMQVETTNSTKLSGTVLTSDYIEYNDRVSLGLYNGKDMYCYTVRYSGKAFLEVLKFCSSVLMETNISTWADTLEGKNVIGYLAVDPDTNLPVTVMFDISEVNTLLQTDKQYLVVDNIVYDY